MLPNTAIAIVISSIIVVATVIMTLILSIWFHKPKGNAAVVVTMS